MTTQQQSQSHAITPGLATFLEGQIPELNPAQLSEDDTKAHIIRVGSLMLDVLESLEGVTEAHLPFYGMERTSGLLDLGTFGDQTVKAKLALTTSHRHKHVFDDRGHIRTVKALHQIKPVIIGANAEVQLTPPDGAEPADRTSALLRATSSLLYNNSENLPGLASLRVDAGNQLIVEETGVMFIREVARSVRLSLTRPVSR